MSDAPEKIWIPRITASVCGDVPTQELDTLLGEPYVEYTRRDIAQARIAQLEEALRFYATPHAIPNDGPWGVNSKDYGYIASIALGETT
jgi:hypothetical protein